MKITKYLRHIWIVLAVHLRSRFEEFFFCLAIFPYVYLYMSPKENGSKPADNYELPGFVCCCKPFPIVQVILQISEHEIEIDSVVQQKFKFKKHNGKLKCYPLKLYHFYHKIEREQASAIQK